MNADAKRLRCQSAEVKIPFSRLLFFASEQYVLLRSILKVFSRSLFSHSKTIMPFNPRVACHALLPQGFQYHGQRLSPFPPLPLFTPFFLWRDAFAKHLEPPLSLSVSDSFTVILVRLPVLHRVESHRTRLTCKTCFSYLPLSIDAPSRLGA